MGAGAAAAIRNSLAGGIASDDGHLRRLIGSDNASTRMVTGYPATRYEGGLMVCTAAREPGGSDNASTWIFGWRIDWPELSARVAAIRGSLADAIAIDDGHLRRLTGSENSSTEVVTGYRPTRYDGDMMFCTAAWEPDGSAEDDSGAAARRGHLHVRGSICTHGLGIAHDAMTVPEVLPVIAAVLESRAKVDRPWLCATC